MLFSQLVLIKAFHVAILFYTCFSSAASNDKILSESKGFGKR